ncbi:flagellar hook-length control protein FliK [Peptococcaceae bacterium CEB3]|nr:flagellar hook-length control protein FliK [Peptococcaceae bacterium CEB3]
MKVRHKQKAGDPVPVPNLPVMGTDSISTPSGRKDRNSSSDPLKTGFAALLGQGLLPANRAVQGTPSTAKGLPVPAKGRTGVAAAGEGHSGISTPTAGLAGNPAAMRRQAGKPVTIEGYPASIEGCPGISSGLSGVGFFPGESSFPGESRGEPVSGGTNPGGAAPGGKNSGGNAAATEELTKLLAGLLSSLGQAATGRGGTPGAGPDAALNENSAAKLEAELKTLAGILAQAGQEGRLPGPTGVWPSILDSIVKVAGRLGNTPGQASPWAAASGNGGPQGAVPVASDGNLDPPARAALMQALRVLLAELSGTVQKSGAPRQNPPAPDGGPAALWKGVSGKSEPQGPNNNSSSLIANPLETSKEPGAAATGGASAQEGRSGGQQNASPQDWAGVVIAGATGRIPQPAAALMNPGSQGAPVEVWQQVGRALAQNLRRESPQIKELTIQLQPEKLGKIQVLLNWDDKQVNLQITAVEDSTAKMLQGHIHDLRNALENAGVACGTLDLGSGGSFGRPWRQNAPQPFLPGLSDGREQVRTSDPLPLPYEAPGDERYRVNITA